MSTQTISESPLSTIVGSPLSRITKSYSIPFTSTLFMVKSFVPVFFRLNVAYPVSKISASSIIKLDSKTV